MLDVNDFIAERGGDPAKLKESQRKRYVPEDTIDQVIEAFQDARKARYAVDQMKGQIKTVQQEIGKLKKNKQDATTQLEQKKKLEQDAADLDKAAIEKELLRERKCKTIGNYVHESVPVNNNEDFNEVIRKWSPDGSEPTKKDCLSHHHVMTRAEFYDPDRGVKLVGHRGYLLNKWGVFLNQALINYGLQFLYGKGYDPIQPPYFMNRELMAKTAQLEQFDEELYKVIEDKDSEDKYLIATSEQPLSAMYANEWIHPTELPQKFAGYSTCFRKEAGSHGRDAWGLFRTHQFEKIEQFLFTKPEDSWQALEDMINTAEEFYKSLKLPYRVVVIVSGALNNAAAKKYDLEAWFPHQGEYKELVSCSNCTDYQTRELEVRYGQKKSAIETKKSYVHALNGTLCAIGRTLCCVLENYQTDDGFEVPEVLRPFMPPGTPDIIPYTKELAKTKEKAPPKPAASTEKTADKLKDLKV